MPFAETCIYQVKPQKVDEFESLMLEIQDFLKKQEGHSSRGWLRGYHIDLERIREGLPPKEITRIIKSVKYVLYWEFDTKESYGIAQKIFMTATGSPLKDAW